MLLLALNLLKNDFETKKAKKIKVGVALSLLNLLKTASVEKIKVYVSLVSLINYQSN